MGKRTIVFAIFFINFIDLGVIKSFSVLMDELVVQLDSDIGTIGTILGMYHGLASLLAPIITPIIGYIPVKWMAFISVVGSVSLTVLSVLTRLSLFAVFILLAGVCFAFVITSMIIRMCETMDEGFALAYGIANAGTAAGMMVLPILTEFLLRTYGWRGTILLLGVINLHTSVLILMVGEPAKMKDVDRPDEVCQPDVNVPGVTRNEESYMRSGSDVKQFASTHQCDTDTDSSLMRSQRRLKTFRQGCSKLSSTVTGGLRKLWIYFGLSMFTDHPYTLALNVGFLVISLVNTAWVIFLIPHGVSKGYPLSRSVFLAFFGSIGQCIGRIGQGPIIDHNWLTSVDLAIVLSVISALTFCLDPLFHKFEVICALALIGGLVNGARVALTVVMLIQFFPRELFKNAYSLNCLFFGLGEPLGGLIAGYIADAFSFDIAFEVLGSFDILLSIVMITTNYFITRKDLNLEEKG